jgi:hypothetical protein
MIGPPGWFTYTAVIHKDQTGTWRGRAHAAQDAARHPGLAGDQPQLELIDGTLTITCTESRSSQRRNPHYARWGAPASAVRLAVGDVPEAVARDGDELTIDRTGTGDCAFQLRTEGELNVGLGAIRNDGGIKIEEDPRADETELYGVAAVLDADATSLVWLNISDPDHESVVRRIECLPAGPWVIAIAGQHAEERRRMNRRVAALRLRFDGGSRWSVDVDERFSSKDEWLAYLRSLPKRRPDDLWIRFTARGESITLKEGEYGFMDPWHLSVQRVYTPGMPGQLSQLAIVRKHPSVSKEMVIESGRAIAFGRMEIER